MIIPLDSCAPPFRTEPYARRCPHCEFHVMETNTWLPANWSSTLSTLSVLVLVPIVWFLARFLYFCLCVARWHLAAEHPKLDVPAHLGPSISVQGGGTRYGYLAGALQYIYEVRVCSIISLDVYAALLAPRALLQIYVSSLNNRILTLRRPCTLGLMNDNLLSVT